MSSLVTLLGGQKRAPIHPLRINGRFTNFRFWSHWVLVVFLLALPWTTIHGQQSVLLDIPSRHFHLFGITFWPSDVHLMIFLLVGAAIFLFFVTALAGRVWCGYACPQTVFQHAFYLPLEDWIEGGRAERLKRDALGWTFDRVWRKTLKHFLFIAFSLLVGHSLVAYFLGAKPLVESVVHLRFNHPSAMGFALAGSAFSYWAFALFREQACIYACPYARFQGAMLDQDSLVVGYDVRRGEPRGKRHKSAEGKVLGDCVDCGKCVVVCPTGIDIRDGLQMECIACARCIDACDSIMDALEKPRGLIRYGTQRELEGEARGKRRLFLRPRVLIYAALLLALGGAFTASLARRDLVEMTVLRPAGAPFNVMDEGKVNNHFTLKILNKAKLDQSLTFALEGFDEAEFIVPIQPFHIEKGKAATMEVFVVGPASSLERGKRKIRIVARDGEGHTAAQMNATFLGPRG